MNLILTLIVSIIVLMTTLTNNYTVDIKKLKELAEKEWPNNPVLVNLTLSQAIVEGGLKRPGMSKLALAPNNNLFGIKWPSSPKNVAIAKQLGKPVNFKTKEEDRAGKESTIKANFIGFNSIEDCLKYRKYMFTWNLYKKVNDAKSVKEAVQVLKESGYATDVQYVKEVVNAYEKYIK